MNRRRAVQSMIIQTVVPIATNPATAAAIARALSMGLKVGTAAMGAAGRCWLAGGRCATGAAAPERGAAVEMGAA